MLNVGLMCRNSELACRDLSYDDSGKPEGVVEATWNVIENQSSVFPSFSFVASDSMVPDPLADFNQDGFVNAADLTQWQGDFGENAASDAEGDGDSDGIDFLVWQQQFGNGGASAATIPEPSSLMLLLAALACKLPWRRRT